MGWNMSKHVETTNRRKWLEKLTFRLVKHVCAWNLPCFLLGHLTPLMWNPLGKRLFCSFLINHPSRSMVLAVQRTFLSNPKPSHVFASRGFPKDWTLNHINFNPIPQKPSQPPQKKNTASQKSTQKISTISACHIFPQFFPQAQERLAESLARQRLESRGALHQAWSDAAQASRRAAALERRLHETRSGSGRHLGRSLGFCWGTTGVPMRIFGWKAILNRDIRDCGSAQWCAWGKAFSSLAKPLSTINVFNAVCTLLFCFGIQLTIQNTHQKWRSMIGWDIGFALLFVFFGFLIP